MRPGSSQPVSLGAKCAFKLSPISRGSDTKQTELSSLCALRAGAMASGLSGQRSSASGALEHSEVQVVYPVLSPSFQEPGFSADMIFPGILLLQAGAGPC